MLGKCKVCGSFDDYAEPNSAGDCYCYIHFVDAGCKCLHCGSNSDVSLVCSKTSYYWEGIGDDPNANILLCKFCAIGYNEYWNEMWDFYYSNKI